MRIAVASTGKEEDSDVSERAARAPYYLVFDEKGKLLDTLSNPFAVGGGGAGFAVAKMLADKGVNVFVASGFGPNIESAMRERGINYMKVPGKVNEVIKRITKGL